MDQRGYVTTEALIYQQRLTENLELTRLYGDTETSKSERAQIHAQLDALAMAVLGVSVDQVPLAG